MVSKQARKPDGPEGSPESGPGRFWPPALGALAGAVVTWAVDHLDSLRVVIDMTFQ